MGELGDTDVFIDLHGLPTEKFDLHGSRAEQLCPLVCVCGQGWECSAPDDTDVFIRAAPAVAETPKTARPAGRPAGRGGRKKVRKDGDAAPAPAAAADGEGAPAAAAAADGAGAGTS